MNAAPKLSILAGKRDLEAGIRQCLYDAFRNLFCFLGTYRVVRMVFSGLAKCRRYY
jgi:hypothetical protein